MTTFKDQTFIASGSDIIIYERAKEVCLELCDLME